MLPRYPIYVPSKGRAETPHTVKFLLQDEVPFHLVIEEQELEAYAKVCPKEQLLILPFRDQGSVIPARNWIREHSIGQGFKRHWQLDDNITCIKRRWKRRRIPCKAGPALRCLEDFTDRYTNIAVSGLNYEMFTFPPGGKPLPPYYLNVRVYSCSLINNETGHSWRGQFNEDADLCLQVLGDGWCTVLLNAFLVHKLKTMTVKGGNTDEIYQQDGRAHMARSLEKDWPHIVSTRRRFQRPQHVVRDHWAAFDTPLKRRDDIDWEALEKAGPDNFGMTVKAIKPVQSESLRKLLESDLDPCNLVARPDPRGGEK